MTYIGKKYRIGDRSYIHNFTTDSIEELTTGTETIIVKDPYNCVVYSGFTHTFVDVLYSNEVIRVLFKKENVIEEPKGITAETFIGIGRMFEEFCGGSKKEEPSEADKLRSEITFLREELKQLRGRQKVENEALSKVIDELFNTGEKQKPIKTREEIERKLSAIQERNKYTTNLRSNWELRARMEALNWVLGKQ